MLLQTRSFSPVFPLLYPPSLCASQVRRSGTGTLEQHEEAIRQVVALKSGKIKRFVLTRVKETLTDSAADIKFVNLGMVRALVCCSKHCTTLGCVGFASCIGILLIFRCLH